MHLWSCLDDMNTYEQIAGIAGDWKAQDGSVIYISQAGKVEKNYNPFPAGIAVDANTQFVFNGFAGELVSPDVILWRSLTSDLFTLWTRQNNSGESSSAFDSNANLCDPDELATETSILEHSAYRRTLHRHRTFQSVPTWVPRVLEILLNGIFLSSRLSKFGFVKLEFTDLFDRAKVLAVNAPVDFFKVAKTEFILNVAFNKLHITPIFPFRRISILVSIQDDKLEILKVKALSSTDALRSYKLGVPFQVSEKMVIRELRPQDAHALHQVVLASSHLDRFLSNFVKETGASVPRCLWALEAWQRASRLEQSLHLGLFEDGQLLGLVHVDKKLLGSHTMGVGEYWLAASATGKGLAPLMLVSALHWAKEAMGIDLVHFDVHPDNEPSIRVLRKIGASPVKQKKKKNDEKIFDGYRLVLDAEWSVLKAAQRPWLSPKTSIAKPVLWKPYLVLVESHRETDDVVISSSPRDEKSVRRKSLGHTVYFGNEVTPMDTPGALAHRMRIPVTGPGIALRQVVGASAGSGSWFIIFVKEFDWNSPSKDAILTLKAFWPDEGYYFGRENVASVVDLNQCDSSDQRDSIIARFKLSLDLLPQGRLLMGGRLIPYEGNLTDINAITAFLNTPTRTSLLL